jgi:hypothetical protein
MMPRPCLQKHFLIRTDLVKAMLFTRIFMWPILVASYGALLAVLLHSAFGNWSGAASLGMLFAVVVGAPILAGYAGYLWRKNLLIGFARWEAALSAAFPVLVLLLGAVTVAGRRLQWL